MSDSSVSVRPQLTTTSASVYGEVYAGRTNNTTPLFSRNSTTTRTNVGRWEVRFDPSHPDGSDYVPVITAYEDSANRDVPKISVVEGSQNADGFDVQITLDDNGQNADFYADRFFAWSVSAPVSVIATVTLS